MSQFFISPEETRRMQLKSLEMALFFDEVCQRHSLTYFLCGGCCIGAARSGEFIPWDDDVDVFMPREDYERLKEVWVDTDEYSLQVPSEELYTANQFMTVCKNSTTFIKSFQKELDINHGIVLDILPLDGCPTGWRRKTQKLWALLYSLFIVGKAPDNHGGLVRAAGKVLLALVPSWKGRCRVWRFCERRMTRYRIADCDRITELCSGPRYMQNELPAEAFRGQTRLSFEGHMLPVMNGYEDYLSIVFGDWRSLPPEDKRVCHHEHEKLDTERSYKEYRGVYYCVKK